MHINPYPSDNVDPSKWLHTMDTECWVNRFTGKRDLESSVLDVFSFLFYFLYRTFTAHFSHITSVSGGTSHHGPRQTQSPQGVAQRGIRCGRDRMQFDLMNAEYQTDEYGRRSGPSRDHGHLRNSVCLITGVSAATGFD